MISSNVGQPVKMDSNKRGMGMSFYVDTEEVKVLDDIRWREHMSLSQIVRKAIKEYIKNHGDGNGTFRLEQFQDPNFRAMPAFMTPMQEWSNFIKENTTPKERKEIDLKARSISGVIRRLEQEK